MSLAAIGARAVAARAARLALLRARGRVPVHAQRRSTSARSSRCCCSRSRQRGAGATVSSSRRRAVGARDRPEALPVAARGLARLDAPDSGRRPSQWSSPWSLGSSSAGPRSASPGSAAIQASCGGSRTMSRRSSYSVVALGVRAHMPLLAARIVAVLVRSALLAAAAWLARDERRTPRDRDVATLTLTPRGRARSLADRLGALLPAPARPARCWFARGCRCSGSSRFAFQPLGEAAWPAGDARKLALALVATLAHPRRRGRARWTGVPRS